MEDFQQSPNSEICYSLNTSPNLSSPVHHQQGMRTVLLTVTTLSCILCSVSQEGQGGGVWLQKLSAGREGDDNCRRRMSALGKGGRPEGKGGMLLQMRTQVSKMASACGSSHVRHLTFVQLLGIFFAFV